MPKLMPCGWACSTGSSPAADKTSLDGWLQALHISCTQQVRRDPVRLLMLHGASCTDAERPLILDEGLIVSLTARKMLCIAGLSGCAHYNSHRTQIRKTTQKPRTVSSPDRIQLPLCEKVMARTGASCACSTDSKAKPEEPAHSANSPDCAPANTRRPPGVHTTVLIVVLDCAHGVGERTHD